MIHYSTKKRVINRQARIGVRRIRVVRTLSILSVACFVFFLVLVPPKPQVESRGQSDLKYQDRGDRHEGIDKGFPVSDRVEIISATVDYVERVNEIPDTYRLKFYLNRTVPVFVRVREIDNKYNYWMDELRPKHPWGPGFDNEFQWPTQEVIKRKHIVLDDLGAVAQLGTRDPSLDMQLSPVILYSREPPSKITKYLFTFKVSRKADVTCSLFKDVKNSAVLSTQSFEMPGQRSRTVDWDVSNVSDGPYRLVITAIYRDNSQKVEQIVHFFHHASVR